MSVFVLLIVFFALLLIGAPIAVALGGSVMVASVFFSEVPLAILGQKIYANLDSFTLMAIPFFFLAAGFMERGGIVKHLVGLANQIVGRMRGGLGMTTVLTCMFFATISGSSPATVAAVGGVMIPALVRHGYPKDYAVGAVSTAGGLGILIPPSIPLILYGFITETSIPKLFIGGILPGIVYGLMLMVLARVLARGFTPLQTEASSRRERLHEVRMALPALSLPLFLIVGIYGFPAFSFGSFQVKGGALFTPTEASIVCALAAILIGAFVYRQLTWRGVLDTISDVMPRVGMIFWILTTAMIFGFYLAQEGVPAALAEWVVGVGMPAWGFLMMVNVILIVAGLFLEGIPMILLFMPVLFPAAQALGIDPIQFGIIVVVNIELALLSPPVGLNLMVAGSIANMTQGEVVRAALPWIAVTVLHLLLVTYVPWISTFLPSLM
ncbi:MAG: TRAP transporter large permease [Lautropia sp.]